MTIDLGASSLDHVRLREAIARELGSIEEGPAPATGRWLSVVVDATAKKATLVFRELPPPGSSTPDAKPESSPAHEVEHGESPREVERTPSFPREVERTVDLPDEPDHAMAAIVLLAGNLARDQASDLVDQMRRERAAQGARAVPATSEPPPEETKTGVPEWIDGLCKAGLVVSAWPPRAVFPPGVCEPVRFELDLPYGRARAVNGAQLGIVTTADGDVRGAQVSLLHGSIGGNVWGVQQSFVTSHVRGDLEGSQWSVIANIASAKVTGAQVAAIANVGTDVRGAQVALVNVASHIAGAQVGLVNIARASGGVQVGLVNIADDPGAEMVGLINIGNVHAVGWITSGRFVHAGLQMGGAHLYTLITGGAQLGTAPTIVDAGAGVGYRVPVGSWFGQVDGTFHVTMPGVKNVQRSNLTPAAQARFALGYDFARHFGVFVGMDARYTVRDEGDDVDVNGLAGVEF